jgi:hypothetical protein
MPTVQRHTQITGDRIKTISVGDLDRIVPDKALDRSKQSYLTQVGSAWLGTTRYVTFPTSFADTPSVTLTRLGSIDMSAYGPISGSTPLEGIHQIVSGSFLSYATPTAYFMWIAQGSA